MTSRGERNESASKYFFDSWGGLYVSCDISHPDAEAFGPDGASRPATVAELSQLGLVGDGTPASLAASQGRMQRSPKWKSGWLAARLNEVL